MGSLAGAIKIAAKRRGLTVEQYQSKLNAGLKWCSRGEHWESRTAFHSDVSRGDGLSVSCGPCSTSRELAARRGDKLKASARNRVTMKIRKGTLPPASELPCVDCGATWESGKPPHEYDHHNGYSRDHGVDVVAVCRPYHVKRGVARGEFRRQA